MNNEAVLNKKNTLFLLLILLASIPVLGINFEGPVRIDMGNQNMTINSSVNGIDKIEIFNENVKFNGQWLNITQGDPSQNIELDLTSYDPDVFEMFVLEFEENTQTQDSVTVLTEIPQGLSDDEEIIVGEQGIDDDFTNALGDYDGVVNNIEVDSQEAQESNPRTAFELKAVKGGLVVEINWDHQGSTATAFDVYRIEEGNGFNDGDPVPSFEDIDSATSNWDLVGSRNADADGTEKSYEIVDTTPNDPDTDYCYTAVSTSLGGVKGPNDYKCGSPFDAQLN